MSVVREAMHGPRGAMPNPLATVLTLFRAAIRFVRLTNGAGRVHAIQIESPLDLSWASRFHTVNIARWSEPTGPDGTERFTWRVVVGAQGYHVSSNHRVLGKAIKEVLSKASSEASLAPLVNRK